MLSAGPRMQKGFLGSKLFLDATKSFKCTLSFASASAFKLTLLNIALFMA